MPKGANIIQIENLSHEGKGVGRLDRDSEGRGKACFVAGALPGETVSWKRTKTKRSFDEGELLEVIYPSPDRVTPKCEHIDECGGCELQHLDPEAQLRAKEEQLKSAFAREGIEPQSSESEESWLPALAGNPWEYRRRTRLAVAFAGQKTFLGYRQRSSRNLVQINTCVVLEPALNKLIQPLRELLASASASGLKQAGLDQVELVAGDQAAQAKEQQKEQPIAVCFSVKKLPDGNSIQAMQEFCTQQEVQCWVREGRSSPRPMDDSNSDYAPLETQLSDQLSMQFTPAQFVQTNAEINRKMIAQAMALLDVRSEHQALDLFCGAGNFSLPIARRAKSMLGVEGLPELIAQADTNAARQKLTNAEFRVADLSKEDALSGKSFAKGSFDRVLLDPPRTGAKNLMPALVRMQAPKLVYISCHPATMVRDIKMLIDGGYRLSKAGVIDMFPQTTHLEAIVLLEIQE